MACRVGISVRPHERIEYWKRTGKYTHGEVLESELTYHEANVREQLEAEKSGCTYQSGGPYIIGPVWSVYRVWKE